MLPYTPSELVSQAWLLIHAIRGAQTEARSLKMQSSGPKEKMPMVARIDEDVRQELYKGYLAMHRQYVELKARARELVLKAAEKLPYIAYLLDTPLVPESIIAVLAHPPDLTFKRFGPAVNPGSWIAVSFIPTKLTSGKVHRPLVAKFFYTMNYPVIQFRHKQFALCGKSETLCNFYMKKVEEEKRKPNVKSEAHARRRALRDVMRVYLGNAWLIAMIDAVERGAVDRSEIVLPYFLAKSPHTLIDPSQASKNPERWRDYTWAKLIKMILA